MSIFIKSKFFKPRYLSNISNNGDKGSIYNLHYLEKDG